MPSQYSNDGPRLTVNDMIKDPVLIPRRFLKMADYEFIMEGILRKAPAATGGVIKFEKDAPLFAQDDPLVVAEGGEIPLTQPNEGIPSSAITIKYGSGIEITKEMKTRNRVDEVNRRMEQVRNTFVRSYENQMFDKFNAEVTQLVTSADAWSSPTAASFRADLFDAIETVAEATDANGNPLGFNPDTLLLSRADSYHLLRSEDFSKHYEGNVADQDIQLSGKLPNKILGLNVIVSRFLDPGTAWVMERNAVGGYSDEYPLSAEALEYEKRRQTWYSVITRRTGIFIDQPKAACKIDLTAGV